MALNDMYRWVASVGGHSLRLIGVVERHDLNALFKGFSPVVSFRLDKSLVLMWPWLRAPHRVPRD